MVKVLLNPELLKPDDAADALAGMPRKLIYGRSGSGEWIGACL